MLSEVSRKILTEEVLGEKWHKLIFDPSREIHTGCVCGQGITTHDHHNRTFTAPDDVFAVKDAIVKMGRWEEFLEFAAEAASGCFIIRIEKKLNFYPFTFIDWLFRTVNEKGDPHFCQLAVDWWKEMRG
jgi:hypothetical protein